ncbi:V-set and immunoglobulin domain-containing protein 1 isoform X6 [Scophthalmus maximus]|uniref:V-set and immunoglobulin domain-containing protein 1 isoform X6 n=1 Tax=Scophthalmus maximus TaxID=52904 RepID=UPI001FA8468F|nr:V-set and immunoglobulin domain-containing protein 1 isoform X6 [Scophthalmus maximus]
MEILPLVCVFLLTRCGTTSADGTGPVVIKMVVNEGNDAILPCSLDTRSIKQELFDWKKDGDKEVFMYDKGSHYNKDRTGQDEQFKGRVFHFPEHLESGNASIVIRHTKVTDSGNYTCDFPFHLPNRRSHIVLVVDPILKDRSDENIPGATPKPNVAILDETKDRALLQCEVHGASPKPHVQWQNRAGNIVPAEEPQVSERGGSYDIVLNTTVTKTDHYRCVSTQDEINHQIYSETFVHISENHTGRMVAVGVPVGVVVGAVVGAVVLSLFVGAVVLFVLKKNRHIILQRNKNQTVTRRVSSEGSALQTHGYDP